MSFEKNLKKNLNKSLKGIGRVLVVAKGPQGRCQRRLKRLRMMLKNTSEKKDTGGKGRNCSNCCPDYCRKRKTNFSAEVVYIYDSEES